MEDTIIKLLSQLPIPAAIISVLVLAVQLKPVTFLTSHEIERKIYTKEMRLLYSVIHYILRTFFLAMLTFSIGELFSKYPHLYNEITLTIIITLSILGHLFLSLVNAEDIKIIHFSDMKKRIFVLIWILIIVICTISFPGYWIGSEIMSQITNMNGHIVESYMASFIVFFIFAMLLNIFFTNLSIFLDSPEKKFIFIEDEQKNKWFLLHALNKTEFLLGDNYIQDICKKIKIMKKEDLLTKDFNIETIENTIPKSKIFERWIDTNSETH